MILGGIALISLKLFKILNDQAIFIARKTTRYISKSPLNDQVLLE